MQYSKIDLTGDRDYLTTGEMLLLTRRRWFKNQLEMAQMLKTSLSAYRDMEHDRAGPSEFAEAAMSGFGEIRHHERCFMYRRRCQKTQREVAADMGVSRLWVNRMERGLADCTELLCYWES